MPAAPAAMPSPAPAARPPGPPAGPWQADAREARLVLQGDWRGPRATTLPPPPAAWPAGPLRVDAGGLTDWDSGLTAALWMRLAPLARAGHTLDLGGLPESIRAVLGLALERSSEADDPPGAPEAAPDTTTVATTTVATTTAANAGNAPPATASARAATKTGKPAPAPPPGAPTVQRLRREVLKTAAFFGEVLLALGRLVRGRSQLRATDLWRELDQAGPLSLPIVALTCSLIGLLLAYMGGAQLDRLGAQSFIADVVTVGMVRELAGLMTGVILTGRLGAAYAAQLGSMQANEEIDALRVLGIDPIDHLVLPRLLALLLIGPLLIAIAALVGVLSGLPAAVGVYGVTPADYLHKSSTALTWNHLWIGLFKGELYMTLVAIAGCMEGLNAGRNAESVGAATTTAVVKALLWIVTAACATTVLFQRLGF